MVSTVKDRIIAAIRGAFIADAASMGVHWIYDPMQVTKTLGSQANIMKPEFQPNPPNPSYYSSDEFPGHYQYGQLSPYGEQLLFVTHYVSQTETVEGMSMSNAMLEWSETFGGRPDHALTQFVENMKSGDTERQWPDCGADDSQAHIYMKIVPIVCRYVGQVELKEKVVMGVRVHQNNSMAIAYGIIAALVLEKIILGSTIDEALRDVESSVDQELKDVDDIDEEDKDEVLESIKSSFRTAKKFATEDVGKTLEPILKELSNDLIGDPKNPMYDMAARSCALPGSFIGPLVLLYRDNMSYTSAIRQNILAAGDTCSRAVYLGAVLGAASAIGETSSSGAGTGVGETAGETNDDDSDKGIPHEWWDEVDKTVRDQVNEASEKIVELCNACSKKQKLSSEEEDEAEEL